MSEIIGPGAGYTPPKNPNESEEAEIDESMLDRGAAASEWTPTLTSLQDEVCGWCSHCHYSSAK
jgi:hypothetical protein